MLPFMNTKKIQETETLRKESLLQQLSYSIKEIQLAISQRDAISTSEGCNSLIVILEAIFLHGLKRGIIKMALKTMTVAEETKPQPSFWNMVCNYTHKDTILRIKKLSQITTDVGRSRVWIRMALNETELVSYITAMEKDKRSLNSFYNNHAFLRDRETCDMACKFLEGILGVPFEIPINSSILNMWNGEPLMLSGVWSPPLKTPLGSAVDVAERIEDDDCEEGASSMKTSSSLTTLSTILAFDEAQALKMILDTSFKKTNKDATSVSDYQNLTKEESEETVLKKEGDEIEVKKEAFEPQDKNESESVTGKGNSLASASGWSSTNEIILEPKPSAIDIEKDLKTEDYSSLLKKAGISPSKKVDYEDRLKKMMMKQNYQETESPPTTSDESNYYNSYTSKLYKIVRETTLKVQKFTCANCKVSIGLTFGEARLCYFTGEYYCVNCHLNETSVIPSRIFFNWDHKKYPVCSMASKFLSGICSRFLIDIKHVNPKLYSAVSEMKELRTIRVQLNMLRIYLYTCKESVLLELQKRVSPREYIYEFIDHYSVNDLCEVPGGALASELVAIVSFGRNHVINCSLCSQKGFICEICKNSKVIYPFDVSTTQRCSHCFAIYHVSCLPSRKNCPKCIRIKLRNLSQEESVNNPE